MGNREAIIGGEFASPKSQSRTYQGEKAMQAAAKADEPDKAMRKAARPASSVKKIMRAAAEADEPEEANREAIIGGEFASPKSQSRTYQGEKAMQAAAKADEPDKAMREAIIGGEFASPKSQSRTYQ